MIKMRYDATGRSNDEVNREAVRLSDVYETVEVERNGGKVTIICRKRRMPKWEGG